MRDLLLSTLTAVALLSTKNRVEAQTPSIPPLEATCQSAAVQDSLRPLFYIVRNKNANIVCYDARLANDGRLDHGKAAKAYWILRADSGQYAGLNRIENWFAYGFDLDPLPDDSTAWLLKMRAYRERLVTVRQIMEGGKVAIRAEVPIGGRPSRFERMYICARERRFRFPLVRYVEIFGRDLVTGDSTFERIRADSSAVDGDCARP